MKCPIVAVFVIFYYFVSRPNLIVELLFCDKLLSQGRELPLYRFELGGVDTFSDLSLPLDFTLDRYSNTVDDA